MSEFEELPPRDRILAAAGRLLAFGGRDAVTTRAVSAEARVQAQTIYRHFGDMRTLLDAVAADGFRRFLLAKMEHQTAADPIEELRAGWNLHIEFAQSNPAIYTLMYGERRPEAHSEAVLQVYGVLRRIVERVAAAGRLAHTVDTAAAIIYAAGIGVAMTLITTPESLPGADSLSATARDALLAAITLPDPRRGLDTHDHGRAPENDVARHAIALHAALADGTPDLAPAELALLNHWLSTLSR